MNVTSFYSQEELLSLGFKSVGHNCFISRNACFYGVGNMSIGNDVRIDDFCILSGNISIGNHVHISAYVALYGSEGIVFEDYTGISARSTIYSAMDDFNGEYLIGPMSPNGTTNVQGGEVRIKSYSQIGAHSLIFPCVTIGEGVVVGAMSMVKTNLDPWGIYYGIPAKLLGKRSNKLLRFIK